MSVNGLLAERAQEVAQSRDLDVPSPCLSVCRMDAQSELCTGCGPLLNLVNVITGGLLKDGRYERSETIVLRAIVLLPEQLRSNLRVERSQRRLSSILRVKIGQSRVDLGRLTLGRGYYRPTKRSQYFAARQRSANSLLQRQVKRRQLARILNGQGQRTLSNGRSDRNIDIGILNLRNKILKIRNF